MHCSFVGFIYIFFFRHFILISCDLAVLVLDRSFRLKAFPHSSISITSVPKESRLFRGPTFPSCYTIILKEILVRIIVVNMVGCGPVRRRARPTQKTYPKKLYNFFLQSFYWECRVKKEPLCYVCLCCICTFVLWDFGI